MARRLLLGVLVVAAVLAGGAVSHAAEMRYQGIVRGGISATGNALGLSKAFSANAPGTLDSIGTFSTLNTTLRDGPYPFGTTDNWRLNGAAASLRLPAGAAVAYAELVWGGSYVGGGEDVSAQLNTS